MTYIRTYKFKLVPTKAQERKFSSWLGGTRFVYNLCLEYKAAWSSRVFIKVPAHYTSQDCNDCGWRHSELKLSDREWTCQGCGATHDRDINAARNIRDKGIEKLKEAGHVFSTFGDIVVNRLGAEEPHGISSL